MSSSIDRLIVSRGPAMVTHRGGFFFSKDDIAVDLSKDKKELPSSAFGPLGEINLGVKASAKFSPVGEFEHLGVLWPYAAAAIGSSIFGADSPLLIQPLDPAQKQVRFFAAGISKMPDLNFTAADSLLGDVEFQMVGKNNTAVDDPAFLFATENNTLDLSALPYDPNALLVQPYALSWLSAGTFTLSYGGNPTGQLAYNISAAGLSTALNALASVTAGGGVAVTGNYTDGFVVTWTTNGVRTAFTGTVTSMPGGTSVREDITTPGAAGARKVSLLRLYPFANFQSREGVKISFSLQLEEDTSDAIGHYDTIFKGLTVNAAAIPQGVADADALAAAAVQGAGSVRGARFGAGAHNLDISGPGVFFRLYSASITKSGLIYSSSKQRVPQLEWSASRSIAGGGALNPLFYIGTLAPA